MQRRNDDRLRAHYDIEVALANKLRTAPMHERPALYRSVYNELFARVPDHPQLAPEAAKESQKKAKEKWRLVRRFVGTKTRVVEVGMGDGAFSALVAKKTAHVTALEVSEEIIARAVVPHSVRVILMNGIHIPLPDASADLVYSNQVMEHLHPDDAHTQLQEIVRILDPRGVYICMTPHQFSGPHDVSGHFDVKATGLHLREYTFTELEQLFREAGFSSVRPYWGGRGVYLRSSSALVRLTEKVLFSLPPRVRRVLSRCYPIRALLGMQVVAYK